LVLGREKKCSQKREAIFLKYEGGRVILNSKKQKTKNGNSY